MVVITRFAPIIFISYINVLRVEKTQFEKLGDLESNYNLIIDD